MEIIQSLTKEEFEWLLESILKRIFTEEENSENGERKIHS